MRCRALTFLCLACASAAYASSEPTKTEEHVQAAPDATQSQTPGAYQFVDPKAVSAMRSFFGQPGMGLTSDKAILSLAAGNPVAGRPAPQLGAPFVAPFKPPTGAEAKAWETYNLRMLSFWYKFEYGFFMFKARRPPLRPRPRPSPLVNLPPPQCRSGGAPLLRARAPAVC